jgi:hypothetical protein
MSVTLGHRDPGVAFLAELAMLPAETEARRSTFADQWGELSGRIISSGEQ